jgi:predicted phosphodiesterase
MSRSNAQAALRIAEPPGRRNGNATMTGRKANQSLTRRRFLKTAAAGLGLGATGLSALGGAPPGADRAGESLSFGLVTDVHYADAPARGSRHYRDSLAKLRQAIDTFNRRRVSFVVELGDFVDAGPSKTEELKHLRTIDKVYQAFQGERHYVLGNHCLHAFTKDEFLANCGARIKRGFYSFDRGRFHFVVLDANFRSDGSAYAAGNFSWTDAWIPRHEQQWLAQDLKQAGGKRAFLFLHQNLHDEKDAHGVKNAPEIRHLLEAAGNVTAVFQGHMHSGGYTKKGGIHYCTLRAMVEGPTLKNNAYAVVTLDRPEGLRLEGFGRQKEVAFI